MSNAAATASHEWEMVAGLEIHAALDTNTKMFCRCCARAFGAEPNTTICPVCAGFPGALPVLSKQGALLAGRVAAALGSEISKKSHFERKSYFYPDLPAGYQISQLENPLALGGELLFEVENGEEKRVRMNRLHLENDAGKLTHADGETGVDLRRAGCPLVEMVTEADFRSPEELVAFLRALQALLRAAGASAADMEKGQLRADVNISVRRRGEHEFGTKTELKNMNSFSAIARAARAEYARQVQLLESGERVVQQTRGWDEQKGQTLPQRSKEDAAEYRYVPDPDVPPLVLTEADIADIKANAPPTPLARQRQLATDYGLAPEAAHRLAFDPALHGVFVAALPAAGAGNEKLLSNWVLGDFAGALNARGLAADKAPCQPQRLGELAAMIGAGEISGKIGKDIFEEVFENDTPPKTVVDARGLGLVSDAGELEDWCQQAIAANAKAAEDFRGGNARALGALVGAVMKLSGGRANPKGVNAQLIKSLGAGGS